MYIWLAQTSKNGMAWSPPELKPENAELLKDFAYVLGWLIKGDGSVFRSGSHFVVKIKCRDYDAVYAASRALSNILRKKFARPRQDEGFWVVVYYSKAFVLWWGQQNLSSLKRFVEFDENTMKEFIRGYFDSDGTVSDYEVGLCGAEGHIEVLSYARQICLRLGMRVGPIRVYRDIGTCTTRSGKRITSKQKGLIFYVNARDFLKTIGGFHHKARDEKLRRMIKGRRWTPWPAEKREEVLELVRQGLSIKEAARRVGVPYLTAYYWVRRRTKSWEEYASERREH